MMTSLENVSLDICSTFYAVIVSCQCDQISCSCLFFLRL
uniref:Uncharacterized protein n=1 Tax=Rhizophora mucronata TaxID=61149 RepID=A0A2P2PAE3_RHIMU